MSRIKRITMSNLPLEQRPVGANTLFEKVRGDMAEFGDSINITDFLGALLELQKEQALVFFGDKADQPIIATQYGFRIYGTN